MQGERPLWQEVISMVAAVGWASQSLIQVIANYRLKNMEGYSSDFYVLALTGGTFYSLFCLIGYFTDIKGTGTVVLGDLVFALMTSFFLLVEMVQFAIYPVGKNRLSGKTVLLAVVMWIFVGLNIILVELFSVIPRSQFWNGVSCLGYCKLVISFCKYIPALYWNYRRKSTKGWPTLKVILDILGGAFSLLSGAVSTDQGVNITKLLLALLTLVYDFGFLFQRYFLYPPSINQTTSITKLKQKL